MSFTPAGVEGGNRKGYVSCHGGRMEAARERGSMEGMGESQGKGKERGGNGVATGVGETRLSVLALAAQDRPPAGLHSPE